MTPQENTSLLQQMTSQEAPHTPKKHPQQSLNTCKGTMDQQSWEQLTSIHQHMFQQAQETFDLLNDSKQPRVDGLPYKQIEECDDLKAELEAIRANAPIYQNWTTPKKEKYFSQLAEKYNKGLRQEEEEQQYSKINDTCMETPFSSHFQNSTIDKSRKIRKSIKTKSNFKGSQKNNRPLFELEEKPVEQETPKRVLFFNESTVRYFSKSQPSDIVQGERQYIFSTFDKF